MYFGQPVDQDATHFLIDVRLLFDVVAVRLEVCLSFETVVVHVDCLQRAVECVSCVFAVARCLAALEVDAVHHGCVPTVHEVCRAVCLRFDVQRFIGDAGLWLEFLQLV